MNIIDLMKNKWKEILCVILTPIAIIFIPFIVNNKYDFFSYSTGLYFFSALVQANASILAIVGVFMIFKIQSIQSSIDMIKNKLSKSIGPIAVNKLEDLLNKYNMKEFDDKAKNILETPTCNYWKEKHNTIKNIKESIKTPTILLIFGTGICALFLMLANFIHSLGFHIESQILLSVLIFEFISLYTVYDAIKKAID